MSHNELNRGHMIKSAPLCPIKQVLRDFFMRFYTYVLYQPLPGFFNALFLHMSLRQLSPRLSGLLILYMSPKHKETHKKRNVPTQKHSLFHYVFIFPVLSVHCCPHPPHDCPHYGLLIRSRTTMPHLRPTQQLLLQLR